VRPAVLLMASRLGGYTAIARSCSRRRSSSFTRATLVHDDIIDESELRRGRLAVHARWGNDVTVLLGDYLYIKSMALALTHDTLDIVRVLCDVTLKMIEGEIFQLTKNGDAAITEDEHFDIIRRKTAFLFGGSRRSAACSGASSKEQEQALQQYGFSLGIAFQLVDDLLDFTGDLAGARQAGRADLLEGKMTLPLIHLLQQPDTRGEIVRDIIEKRAATNEQWDEILALLHEHRRFDYASRRAVEFAERAKKQLAIFPPSSERDASWRCPTTCFRATGNACSPGWRVSPYDSPVPTLSPDERLRQLREQIRHHEERYYILNDPK
jgi:octaprenyl-diphosphate synthase